MGFGQTSLSGVRRGIMPPQLKTNKTTSVCLTVHKIVRPNQKNIWDMFGNNYSWSIDSKIYEYILWIWLKARKLILTRNTKTALTKLKVIRCPLTSWDYGSRKLSAYYASPLLTSCQFDATKPTNALDGMFGPKPALGEKGEALQTTFSSNDSVLTFFDIFQYSAAIFVTFLVILF